MSASSQARVTIAGESASPVTFEDIAAFPPPGWNVPRLAQVSPDGKLVTYLQSEAGGAEMALFAFDRMTGKHRVLVRASDLTQAERKMSREEELRRERQRKRITGITDYAWAQKAPVLLISTGDEVFTRDAEGAMKALSSSPEPEIDPQLCADGSRVAFVRGRELSVIELKSGAEKQLTRDAPEGVTRGQSDYNMQEEFNEPSGFWWSPSCDRIAFLEVDERKVARIPILGYRGGTDLQSLAYPRVGAVNPRTRLGIMELKSGRTVWVELPASEKFADQYLGRVRWSDDGKALFFQRLSRNQQHLALVRVDAATGKGRHLLEESDAAWVELSEMLPLAEDAFLWTAVREGHRHLELRHADGSRDRQLTNGTWDISRVVGVDRVRRRVLFMANKDAPLDRQLYAVSFAGSPEIERMSREPGVHDVEGRRPDLGFVDIHSASNREPRAVIHGPDGKAIADIAVPPDDEFPKVAWPEAEIVTIPSKGGPLYGALLKPKNLARKGRHPAIVVVYGGPGVQSVLNEWNPRLLWQHLADRGFVVFQLDNRGSSGRGHQFAASLYRRMGDVELEDQLRGLDYLQSLDFVDRDRIGIYGHSYGGYMAALAMLRAPGRFRVAVAGSPVTDWTLYDTGYTERYMSTPRDNPGGYQKSALPPLAGKLVGKLLLVHALMDENVHFEHTAKLIDALVEANKDFDLLLFPGERHGYRSPAARRYAYRRVVDYFVEHL